MSTHQQASTGQIVNDTEPVVDGKADKVREVNGQPVMYVKVHSPFKVYFEGDAYSISAQNDTGIFDILPRHHNFMTLLNPCDIKVQGVNGSQSIRINRGVMHVKADRAVVFLDV